MKSPDEVIRLAREYVNKHNDGKQNPLAVEAFIEGYTMAFDDHIDDCTSNNDFKIEIIDEFGMFWNLYDKKVGKEKCQKLWHKLSKKDKEKCLDYIPLYKQAQPDKKFRKNPETFLRNKSWNDELIYNNEQRYNPEKQLRSVVTSLAEEVYGDR